MDKYEFGEVVEKRQYYLFEWRTKDYLVTSHERYYFWRSPKFKFSNENWELKFVKEKDNDWLGVELSRDANSLLDISVSPTLGLKAADGTLHNSKRATNCFKPRVPDCYFVWPRVVKKEELVSQKSKLCPNGMITIYCEFRLNEDNRADSQSHILELDDNANLAQNIADLYLKQQLCDVTINVGDRKFQAHRSVLAARSTTFASFFERVPTERSANIKFDCDDPDAFHDFLIYLYSAKVDITSTQKAIALYSIAHACRLPRLTSWCEQFLLTNLSVESFCDVLVFAMKYGNPVLIKTAEDFFAKYTEEILVTVKWQNFMKENNIAANELFIKCAQTYKSRQ